MAGRGAGGFVSIHWLVPVGVTDYSRVVLHPRLQQDVCPVDLLLINLSNLNKGFPPSTLSPWKEGGENVGRMT